MTVWPEEANSWTNAVVLMAADAIYELTPGRRIFSHDYWMKTGIAAGPANKLPCRREKIRLSADYYTGLL
jgi:hypothetical protein